MNILIADSGATKCEWCLLYGKKKKILNTQGISPYFLDSSEIQQIIKTELVPALGKRQIDKIYFYGTGCAGPANKKIVYQAIEQVFSISEIHVDHDLMGAAIALCGSSRGIVCNLGTGSFSCYFDGKKILKSIPGLGYVLGDEGSGAYLGKKVLQHYLYGIFDEELRNKFDEKYRTTALEILAQVYKKPFPNRYLASFAIFLAENRGHYMIENIIEDGINDFFFVHLSRFEESRKAAVHFVGGVADGFRDVLQDLALCYGLKIGRILKKPMDGLILFHKQQ
jgi:glucosamine kinase